MPFRLPRIPRPVAVATTAVIAVAGVGFSASTAQADTRTGDVSVSMPSRIVLDGSTFPVVATSGAMYSSLDKLWVNVYKDDSLETLKKIAPNTVAYLSTVGVDPGQLVTKADLPMTSCDYSSTDSCYWNSDYTWYYEFIHGLAMHESSAATAKYGSKIALAAVNDGAKTIWVATAQQYGGYDWEPWSGAAISIGSHSVTADSAGRATWTEPTSQLHTYTATASESDTVWGGTSAAVTPSVSLPSTPAKPGHVTPSATASKAASAMKKGLPSVRKVVTLTKKNDVNKLLGKKNGYVSAAVLYDKRTTCSDGPGVDCGATIEKFTSISKAKARAKHIQALLKKYSFLGTEYDTVHGHFLLRVSGDLTSSQAKQYKTVFGKAFG